MEACGTKTWTSQAGAHARANAMALATFAATKAVRSLRERNHSKQHDIELLLRVLLLRLEADRLADEGFQFGDRRRFLFQHARDHARRGQHQQFLGVELAHRAGDLAEDL